MDTYCFCHNEIITIDEFERSVYMNAKESHRVDVCIYGSQVSNQIYFFYFMLLV